MSKDISTMRDIVRLIARNSEISELRSNGRGNLNISMLAAKMADFGQGSSYGGSRSGTWKIKGDYIILTLQNGLAKQFNATKIKVSREIFGDQIKEALGGKITVPPNLFDGYEWVKFGHWLNRKQTAQPATRQFEPQTHFGVGGSLATRS